MDKAAIRFGLRHVTKNITARLGHSTVSIPKYGNKPCQWKSSSKDFVTIPFDVLHDIIEFALDNTLIKDFDGQLWQQTAGIPMGDPHSPGACIGACAWMEHEWMQTIDAQTKAHFAAARYMDDVLLLWADSPTFDSTRFLHDFCKSECYLPPLNLEAGKDGTFLEACFEITRNNTIRHWVKNVNEMGKPTKIVRYAHFNSHTSFAQKKSIMMACLKKVALMASDNRALRKSATDKLYEFYKLSYPKKMLWAAATTMGVQSRNPTWFDVRDSM